MTITLHINDLIKKRAELRKSKKFVEADLLREKIEFLGYKVTDTNTENITTKIMNKKYSPKRNFLILFGSGEISSSGRIVHDYVFNVMDVKPVRIAIITTPAGFQPNVKKVHEEIRQFFLKSLTNYSPEVKIIYANTKDQANDQKIVRQIENADYLFLGPGSPTYAVKNLKDTLLLESINNAVSNGATLALSSAAVLAFSCFTLPVYEIYKAGFPLYWENGLDFYKLIYQEMSVIPHFNNTEGMPKLDTSCCYIGKERFLKLKKILPSYHTIVGIDEHTALIVDLKTKETKVMGKGGIHNQT